MKFTFVEVKDKDLLEKVFQFRYKIICETEILKDYFCETVFLENKESDKYDPYSIHFAVLDGDNEVCATVRLIYNSPLGYPTENDMIFNRDKFDRDKLGELSRIFIDKKYRSMKITKHIIYHLNKLLYVKMIELNIEYTYGALEPRFMRLLKIFNMNYEILGENQMQCGIGPKCPSILYTKKFGEDNPEFINTRKEENDI